MTSVWDGPMLFLVKWQAVNGHKFTCTCEDFKKFRHICSHCVALADFQGRLFGFLQFVMEECKKEEAAEVLRLRSEEMAGKKPGDRKGRPGSAGAARDATVREVRPALSPPKTSLSQSYGIRKPNERELNALMSPKTNYTKEFHNDNPFILVKFKKFRERFPNSKTTCRFCSLEISKRDVPPDDVVWVHWEKYQFPGANGQWKWSTKQLRAVAIHFRYHCLVGRYPYVSVDLMKIEKGGKLCARGEKFGQEQFGVPGFEEHDMEWDKQP